MGMALNPLSCWPFPMKPCRINQATFEALDKTKYTLEPKHDGHRIILVAGQNQVFTYTREKRRTQLPLYLIEQLESLNLPIGTILDGEVWNRLKRGGWKKYDRDGFNITFWDVIRIGIGDYSINPIEERREALAEVLDGGSENIFQVEVLKASAENVEQLHQRALAVRSDSSVRSGFIHGVVLKKKGSPRRDHAVRSVQHPDWLKILYEGMEGWEPRI
jgi:ATP-dependent DNA ligase